MKLKKQSGFTLIEMAIVLAIIGLILGAVSIGRDTQRSAEHMKIKQKFVDQWAQAYNQYYQKTGVVIGDSQVDPRFMVAGSSVVFPDGITSGGAAPGIAAGIGTGVVPLPNKICHGQGYALGAVGLNDRPLVTTTGVGADAESMDLFDQMDRHGITMPPGRAEGREDRYLYLDSNGNPVELQVCFQWNQPQQLSGNGEPAGNVMVLRGLTPDLARQLDQMIDGKPDAREGRFRMQGVLNVAGGTTIGTAGVEWDASNTRNFLAASGTGATVVPSVAGAADDATRLDEEQIQLVTAHYQMTE